MLNAAAGCRLLPDEKQETPLPPKANTEVEAAQSRSVAAQDLKRGSQLNAKLVGSDRPDQAEPEPSIPSPPLVGSSDVVDEPDEPEEPEEPEEQEAQSYEEFLKSVAQARTHKATGFRLDEYSVVGLVTSKKRSRALVQGPDGQQHIVGARSRLGNNGATVVRVGKKGLLVREADGQTRRLPFAGRAL